MAPQSANRELLVINAIREQVLRSNISQQSVQRTAEILRHFPRLWRILPQVESTPAQLPLVQTVSFNTFP
jgi:hypothetical protein